MTTQTIDLEAAGQQLAELVQAVLHGGEVIITRGDEPIARVVPFSPGVRGGFGSAKDVIRYIADDFDETPEDFAEYLK